MSWFQPDKLAQLTGGVWSNGVPRRIIGFAFDARQLKLGQCFIALSGGARDGHDFVGQARDAGACAALVEQPVGLDFPQLVVPDTLLAMASIGRGCRRAFKGPVLGITGSSGKTSTKEMLRSLIGPDSAHATPGNWNNRIGVPMTLFGLDNDTQDCAVIEAGINQPGEMAELGRMIEADLTIVTNIGTAHLELLKNREGIAEEKSKLALYAREDSALLLPLDAMRYQPFRGMADRAIVVVPSHEEVPFDVRKVYRYESSISVEAGSTNLTLREEGSGGRTHRFEVASLSRGMAENACLAYAAAVELELPEAELPERMRQWSPGETRGHYQMVGDRFIYADCYNANPESMLDALRAFGRAAPGPLSRCYVLGAMNELGERASEFHEECAAALSLRAEDRVFFVGPESLTDAYSEGALTAGAKADQIVVVKNVDSIKSAVAEMGGALFLKGSRGYALEKLIPATERDSQI